jgi:hypothetical protein
MEKLRKHSIYSVFIVIGFLLTNCSVTTPMLGLSGGNYNSITDDILLYNSSNSVIEELVNAVKYDNVLVVQTINDANSDMLAEKIFETLSRKGKSVGLAKRSELSSINVEVFDKLLFFYPTVFGIETAATRPTSVTYLVGMIPVIGQIVGPPMIEANTYDTRLGAISLHARLVDSKTGQIEWMNVFQGKDRKKITSKSILDIVLPVK